MEPSDDCTTCSSEGQGGLVSSYELAWENISGQTTMEIIAADSLDVGDLYEFWLGGELLFSISVDQILYCRNISAMDMS